MTTHIHNNSLKKVNGVSNISEFICLLCLMKNLGLWPVGECGQPIKDRTIFAIDLNDIHV